MQRLICLVLFSALAGCATTEYYQPIEYLTHNQIKIEFGRITNSEHVGLCFRSEGKIVLDLEYWRKITSEQRAILLAHEIGHCVFDWAHLNVEDEQGCPKSVMNWRIPPQHCLSE